MGSEPQHNGASNEAPSEDKPHTFSDIAHRAVGDHRHRRPEGDDGLHDRFQSGGDHPGLDRNEASGHFSHSMPGSALTKARKRELAELDREKEKSGGSGGRDRKGKGREQGDAPRDEDEVHDDGDSSDGLERLKDGEGQDPATRHAAHALRDAVGGDLDPASSTQKDSDLKGHAGGRRIDREEKEAREVERATRRVEREAEEDESKQHLKKPSAVQQSQGRFLDEDFVPPRQPTDQSLSYPYTGHRPEHAYQGRNKEEMQEGQGSELPEHQHKGSLGRRDAEDQREEMNDEEKEEDDRERLPKHDERPNENGKVPPILAPTKKEERPGPRNEINLKPRITKIQYHTVDAVHLHEKADHVPLKVAPDGETEDLPNGKAWKHAPDPEDRLTSTRSKERELLGLKKQPDDDENAEYDDERILRGDHIGPSDKHGPLIEGDRTYDYGAEEEDSASSSDYDHEEGHDRVGDMDGPRRGSARERIPKADPEHQQELMSANESPATKRPKNQRIWSTFRRKGGEGSGGPSQPPKTSGSASHSRSGSVVEMQGPLDAEKTVDEPKSTGQQKWTTLRAKLLHRNTNNQEKLTSPAQIPVTTELLAGQLPAMILKTWLDRDENGARNVPVLLGSLKFRVGDSAGFGGNKDGQQTGREVFRIECEYGDGAVKWVIYRELRDFVSLHTHYKADNLGTRVSHLRGARRIEIPEFPKTSTSLDV